MSRLMIIIDGMADLPGNETDGGMSALHSLPIVGEVVTETRADVAPTSERAIMSLLGYDIARLELSRSRLEAMALGLDVAGRRVFRVNLVDDDGSAVSISDREAQRVAAMFGSEYHAMDRYRMLLVTDREPLSLPDGLQIIRSDDRLDYVEPLSVRAKFVGATHLIEGIAWHVGAAFVRPKGATGHVDSDFGAKMLAARASVAEGTELTVVHIEAADEAAHMRNPQLKADILSRIDRQVIAPLLELGVPTTVCADHITDAITGRHYPGVLPLRANF